MKRLIHQTIPPTDLQANQTKDTLTTWELTEILKKYNDEDGRSKPPKNPIQKPQKLKMLESRSKKK